MTDRLLPMSLLAFSLVVLGAPLATAHTSDVRHIVFDRVEAVPATEFQFSHPCQDSGAFVPLEDGFRFEERQGAADDATPYPGGYLSVGCGEASVARTVPAGAKSVEVHFQGDRVVQEFAVGDTEVARPGTSFEQRIAFRGTGSGDRAVDYMDPGAGSVPLQPVVPDSFLIPRNTTTYELAWLFRDQSYFVGPDFPDVLSGQAFSATVQKVVVRYPDLPVDAKVSDSLQREGTLVVGKTRIVTEVADPQAGDLRIEVAEGLAFSHLRAPDGTRFDTQTSRLAIGPDGFDRSSVLVETLEDGAQQVTVPSEVLASLGAGKYTVVFTSVDAVHTYPWLIPLAVLILLAPLPFALLAYHHVRRFEDEAFGGFRRSARNLRVALVVAFAYYLAVLISHFVGSRLDLMTAWPLPFEAVLLYLQVVIAVGAFLALFAVARELYRITVPKALPDIVPSPQPFHEDHE